MAQTHPPQADAASRQALIDAVQQAKLHLELVMSRLGGGQLSSEAVALLTQARAADTNSGCNTSCHRVA